MAKYKLTSNGVKDTETGANIPNAPGNRNWTEYQEWLAEGNTPDPQFTPEELSEQEKSRQLEEINQTMGYTLSQPVECLVGGVKYIMDGGMEDATRLKAGIDLCYLLGETSIDVVDYNNQIHYGVSLEDALEIAKLQGQYFRAAFYKRIKDRAKVLGGGAK